jgi:hypothetical protein
MRIRLAVRRERRSGDHEQLDRAGDGQGEERDRETPENEGAHRCLGVVRVTGAPPEDRC